LAIAGVNEQAPADCHSPCILLIVTFYTHMLVFHFLTEPQLSSCHLYLEDILCKTFVWWDAVCGASEGTVNSTWSFLCWPIELWGKAHHMLDVEHW